MSMRRTEFSVDVSDGESTYKTWKAGVVVEEARAHYDLDTVLDRAEELCRREWGDGILVYFLRFGPEDMDPEAPETESFSVSYHLWVWDGK